jgi:hypothetical protein
MNYRTGTNKGMDYFLAGYGGNKGLWPAEFVRYLYFEGLRGEQVRKDISDLKAAFAAEGHEAQMWDLPEVKTALSCVGRTNDEIRARLYGQMANAKYDMVFAAMHELWKRLNVERMVWSRDTTTKEANDMITYLVAYVLFDVGVRGGNLASTGKDTARKGKTVPADKLGGAAAINDDTPDLVEDEDGDEIPDSGDVPVVANATGHVSRCTDWTFAFPDGKGGLRYVLGQDLADHWERYPIDTPEGRAEYIQVIYPTSKTSNSGTGAVKEAVPATMARRSLLESTHVDYMCAWRHWTGKTQANEAFFVRRPLDIHRLPNGKHTYGPFHARLSDVTAHMKAITVEAGVDAKHSSIRSFRKGNLNTMKEMGGEEEAAVQARMIRDVSARGGKWAKGSSVPRNFYLVTTMDIGPYGRVETWEEAVNIGGGFQKWRNRQGATAQEVDRKMAERAAKLAERAGRKGG